jgi:hypothetical protein
MNCCIRTVLTAATIAVLAPNVGAWAQAPATHAAPAAAAPGAPARDDVEALRVELERLRAEFADVERLYDARFAALEREIARINTKALETQAAPAPVAGEIPPPAPAAPQDPAPQPSAAASKVFNPDISVNGNFIAVGGKHPGSDEPPLALTEVEAALQAVVDPYSRADFFLAAGPEGLEVEEGFITFTGLPGRLLLKAGKIRAQFGKVNTLHTHQLPAADRPLVTEYLVGGDEGLSDAGVSLSHLIQNPYLFLEATGEVFAARSDVFSTTSRSRLNYLGRVRAYRDLAEDKNIEVGTSVAFGPVEGFIDPAEGAADLELNKRLVGIDATFRYRPLRRAIYQRLNLRTELVWSRQDRPGADPATAFGLYGLGEYQFARRWYGGARVDRSARPFDPDAADYGGAVFVTFWPTEYSQIRTQFRRLRFAEGTTANEMLFQFNFSIGAHAAHAF